MGIIYNPAVLNRTLILTCFPLLGAAIALAQVPDKPAEKPQVRVNYLNVCTPAAAEQQELNSVLTRVSSSPAFAIDLEVARGRSTLNPTDLVVNTGQPANTAQTDTASRWVRIRRDFPENAPLTSAQYSFSVTEHHVSETLVLHFRDVRDVLQLAINDSVESAADPGQVARLQTPADRIRVERFGKSSIVLARCPNADQSAYEPIFQKATALLNAYRRALNIASTVPGELSRIPIASPKSSNAGKSSNSAKSAPKVAKPKPR
jgi:hypothetical protein